MVIAGGGDSAVDWALSLAEVADKVLVVHRRDKFRAAPDCVRMLGSSPTKAESSWSCRTSCRPGRGRRPAGAVIVSDLDGKPRTLEADGLLPFFGLAQNLGPIADWGLDLDRNLIRVDPATCATGRAGMFAIGDIAHYRASSS